MAMIDGDFAIGANDDVDVDAKDDQPVEQTQQGQGEKQGGRQGSDQLCPIWMYDDHHFVINNDNNIFDGKKTKLGKIFKARSKSPPN